MTGIYYFVRRWVIRCLSSHKAFSWSLVCSQFFLLKNYWQNQLLSNLLYLWAIGKTEGVEKEIKQSLLLDTKNIESNSIGEILYKLIFESAFQKWNKFQYNEKYFCLWFRFFWLIFTQGRKIKIMWSSKRVVDRVTLCVF